MIIHSQEEMRYHDDGPPVSLDCFYMCSPDMAADCTKDWCSCQCHQWVGKPDDRPAPVEILEPTGGG